MFHNSLVTENQLDEFVRGNAKDAQGLVPELVYRLVAASAPKPTERRFPLGDSVGQHGPDGTLRTDIGFEPFVPAGRSYWEIGTGLDSSKKATSDYEGLVTSVPIDVRLQSSFIFVTPLSGRRDWKYTFGSPAKYKGSKKGKKKHKTVQGEEAQAAWLEERCKRADWKNVRILDGSKIIDWLLHFPSVERWLAKEMRLSVDQIETPEQHWEELRRIGDPPPLLPKVFLVNREQACAKLSELFSGNITQLRLDTRFPSQISNFVAAYIAEMDSDARTDTVGRCLLISGKDAWNSMAAQKVPHVLLADFDIDMGDEGTKLLERARRNGHSVIYGGAPGGVSHPNRVSILNSKVYQLQEVLEKSGYKPERARTLAQKSDGNLSSLLRCLHNLALAPAWSQDNAASELENALLLGGWNEGLKDDKSEVEQFTGKAYGEWIAIMRKVALRPGTPLIQHNGIWKFVSRYEGWYALGPRVFDDHLDRLKDIAIKVLSESDPKFELPADQRFAAGIHGKRILHSGQLRKGLADTLALLGSHPQALSSCSTGKPEAVSANVVRTIFSDADWKTWASLNGLMPLLAEAAPMVFLEAVEQCLDRNPSPITALFQQEGDSFFGGTHISGLLWALETLAWDPDYLPRVTLILGDMASKDPGGKWSNRPANSLIEIFLPWYPQTCATIPKRRAAMESLLNEFPEVGWKVLLNLLPESHQNVTCTAKPIWRETIPQDWRQSVILKDYWEEVDAYADFSIGLAKQDVPKLTQLIDRIENLPDPARKQILMHLRTPQVSALPIEQITQLWTKLVDLISRHRKHIGAEWVMSPDTILNIEKVANELLPDSPLYRHQRLFGERDFEHFEKVGAYEDQVKALEERRQVAVNEILESGGSGAIVEFAQKVEAPSRVGIALGCIGTEAIDSEILPKLLSSTSNLLKQFTGGYVWSRFRKIGWNWADSTLANWSLSEKGQFLAYLPFNVNAWERVSRLMSENESQYWLNTNANPYDANDKLEEAVDRLMQFGRIGAALRCLEKMAHDKRLKSSQAARVLIELIHISPDPKSVDVHAIISVIKALQEDESTVPDDLFKIEWAYLSLLDRHNDAAPKLLEKKLANEPEFFCEVIRFLYRSKKDIEPRKEPSEQEKNLASNAYRLLHHWKMPPGTQDGGRFDSDLFENWLGAVRKSCIESGHLIAALSRIGHVLKYAAKDPDGLWLNHSIAKALNAKDAEDMRVGFRQELYNSRGVHAHTKGNDERKLAKEFRAMADAVDARRYHRLAKTMRDLALSYEREAEQEAENNPFEE